MHNMRVKKTTVGDLVNDQTLPMTPPIECVVSKGGAYFFTPSISALKTKLTA